MAATIATPAGKRGRTFTRFAWGVLGWNLLVVLWGAYVRASGSGAGCGGHWPLCNGEVVPAAPQIQTIIEFTHRLMSGVALIAVGALWFWSRRAFAPGHRVRKAAAWSAIFLIAEAALGAGLVLFDYVGGNASVGRAVYLSLHLVNTEFLLAMLALTAWWSRQGAAVWRRSGWLMTALGAALLVSVTGTIAALGDTLFPATSLAQGLHQDLSAAGSFLLRLRILHPALAILAGVFFIVVAIRSLRARASRLAVFVLALAIAQLTAGAVNVLLLAPIWMQITHLLLADLLWIGLVLLATV
ncbi:MAG TPA: COX15/CtaA family protein [Bryobacteraceae bacterium]|nr:COX15/CtaA family protein [Bryobacteraceae bacterium]